MYAPPPDYSSQLLEMLIAGKPEPVQPVGFNVPSVVMPSFGGGGEQEDGMNLGAAGSAMDLTDMLMDYFKNKGGGPSASPLVQGLAPAALGAMTGGAAPMAFNTAAPAAMTGMLGDALKPSASPMMLKAMLGL